MPNNQEPLRMCVVTRKMLPKSDLIRIVVTSQGIIIDKTKKMDGRGYWISSDIDVIRQAHRKHILDKVLRHKVEDSLYTDLEANASVSK